MSDKLTKAHKEFFQEYVENIVQSVMQAVLAEGELEMDPEAVKAAISTIDLTTLRNAAATEFLKRATFSEIKRIDKIMKSDEFRKVVQASAEVGYAVQDVLLKVVGPLVPAQ